MLSALSQRTISAFLCGQNDLIWVKYLCSERTFIFTPFKMCTILLNFCQMLHFPQFRKSYERRGVDCLQAELNQGGGWERLCMERDPFILTGLMWSWLEQLKEPVISVQQAKDLNLLNGDPPTLANTLGRVSASFETGNMR